MEAYGSWAEETLKKVREKMAWVVRKNGDRIPYTTDETGSYDDRSDERCSWNADDGLNWWTNGFWGGILWQLYRDTGDMFYAETAKKTEKKLETCFSSFYGLHHDVGFMFLPTSVANYRLTGDPDARRNALHAANLLAGRFLLYKTERFYKELVSKHHFPMIYADYFFMEALYKLAGQEQFIW